MPIELSRIEDLKDYIADNPQAKVFYRRKDRFFEVLAGRVAWRGSFENDRQAAEFEEFLKRHDGVQVKGWIELEQVFSEIPA
ncbi:hypothetical protein B9Q03_10195 [Candidatus Marsarchaeota G2 archaeon OSP_D]|jgi:hypothetical protein|uniref:DUF5678 domain-containing protein n=2 Tax=Candidatus Marsarchaeota TaxID=1978152 RepID=A0A2R6ACQ6_9ARCH|nr:MAG: hypothetical protein B9Q02_09800 [Candidatus Marsarchaeota G1 archaeon BE_D]PSN87687.1 MAG: hypothetical protein B9Q03_10195 [Candidatus Marsarchaeota G2 archaeon OSP_D]